MWLRGDPLDLQVGLTSLLRRWGRAGSGSAMVGSAVSCSQQILHASTKQSGLDSFDSLRYFEMDQMRRTERLSSRRSSATAGMGADAANLVPPDKVL